MSAFDENPFADPSVQQAVQGQGDPPAASNPAQQSSNNLEDYNPFENKAATTAAWVNNSSPAVMNPTTEQQPPNYQPTAQQQISTADFQRRQEELERRARDLERREEELKNSPYNVRVNNWPPIPSFCPVQPCFYQDINVDIPVEFQRIVRNLYYLWVAHVALLLANMIVALFYLFAAGDKGQTFGLALVYWFIFTPASFVCWFRPAYKAFRDDSSFNFMVFFFVFFFQFLISILYALGIQGVGSCGIILAIGEIGTGGGGHIFVGVCMLLTGIGFALLALGDFYMLVTIHRLYRSTGASMAKAQAEFTSGVMRNEQVQAAAAAAARETISRQFAGGAQQEPASNTQAPRY